MLEKLDHYVYFHEHDGSYEALLNLESVDADAGTAGQYPTMRQWDTAPQQDIYLQQDRWIFAAGGQSYIMQNERQSPRGVEYVQVLLSNRGEMTVRQLTQLIKSVSTETIRQHLEMLIELGEVVSKQVGKKIVYYSTIKPPPPSVDPLDNWV